MVCWKMAHPTNSSTKIRLVQRTGLRTALPVMAPAGDVRAVPAAPPQGVGGAEAAA